MYLRKKEYKKKHCKHHMLIIFFENSDNGKKCKIYPCDWGFDSKYISTYTKHLENMHNITKLNYTKYYENGEIVNIIFNKNRINFNIYFIFKY